MHLYDVYYRGSAMDCNVRLPNPGPDIRYAQNTNWDRHTLRPVRMADGSWEWTAAAIDHKLFAPTGISSTSPEGQQGTREALAAMRLISSRRSWGWAEVAVVTMRAEDVAANRAALAEGWRLVAA